MPWDLFFWNKQKSQKWANKQKLYNNDKICHTKAIKSSNEKTPRKDNFLQYQIVNVTCQ